MRLTQVQNTLLQVAEHFRPKTAEERRIKALWAVVVMIGVVIAWGIYTYTTL